jgi:hypothetical protein
MARVTRVTLSRSTSNATQMGANSAALLAARLPLIVLEARRIAALLAVGLHGRGRAGPGETFWQYRAFSSGESANRIDWRRSARHENQYFVREREWEAAHTVHLWIDRSASMYFSSDRAQTTKADRALVIGLALADLLVRSGESVALIGLMKPTASRRVIDLLAEAFISQAAQENETIPSLPLASRGEAVLISDFLEPVAALSPHITMLASLGAKGHLLRVFDPVEANFPFEGETEFLGVETKARIEIGDAAGFRNHYLQIIGEHDAALQTLCSKKGWDFSRHSTDQSASSALLPLIQRISAS